MIFFYFFFRKVYFYKNRKKSLKILKIQKKFKKSENYKKNTFEVGYILLVTDLQHFREHFLRWK